VGELNILIVEDEAIVAADLAAKLKGLDYIVSGVASTGQDAVDQVRDHQPDLILMDIQLEGQMDGVEAAEAIRMQHDVPIIYLTAHSDPSTLARAKVTGPFGYILKPFEERELATQIELAFYKHRTDRELLKQREWLRVTLTSIGDAVIATDSQGNITFINPVAESLTGWTHEKARERSVQDVYRIVNEDTGTDIKEPVVRALLEGDDGSLTDHTALRTWDGRIVPIEACAAPIRDGFGRIIGSVIVFHDVTEKRRAEEALLASEKRLRQAQKIAHLGSWELDIDNNELTWSDEVYRIFGLMPQQFGATYEAFLDSVHPEDREKVHDAYFGSLRDNRDTYEINHRVVRPSGEVRFVHEKCEHYRGSSGSIVRSVGMVHDITEQKQTQDALVRSNEELEQFAFAASHDLQEPLRAIIGFLQLFQSRYENQIDEKGRHFITRSMNAGCRLQTMIEDLLMLSRVNIKGGNFEQTDLNSVKADVMDSLRSVIEKKMADVVWDRLPNLVIDGNQIRSLFQNLIQNGLLYNKNPAPLIEIRFAEEDREYHFMVKDNGIGIEPQFFRRIFVVFQRLHSDRDYPGTGLGLALCQKIVDRHGGSIWVESQPGAGSTFHFTLPKKGEFHGANR